MKAIILWKCNVFTAMPSSNNMPFDMYLDCFRAVVFLSLFYCVASYYQHYYTNNHIKEWFYCGICVGIATGIIIYEMPTRVIRLLLKWKLIPKKWFMNDDDDDGNESCKEDDGDGYEEDDDGLGKPKTL